MEEPLVPEAAKRAATAALAAALGTARQHLFQPQAVAAQAAKGSLAAQH